MPTQIKARGNAWLARVIIHGQEVDSKIFPPGHKKGPEWLEARQWEIKRKQEILKQSRPMPTGYELLLVWGEKYLAHAEQTMSRQTFVEKKSVMAHFFEYCRKCSITAIEQLTKPVLLQWLDELREKKGSARANRYRQNLLAAWNWGIDAIEGFPQDFPVLQRIKPFPVESEDRYVPPEEDIIKVLQAAQGQDLVMLLAFYYTGARRGEIFRLQWSDIDLINRTVRLTDHKGGRGKKRTRWLPLHPTLADALIWWQEARPCKVDNVFMRMESDAAMGQPFTERNKLMPRLCAKAGVKPFGFHAIRHKAASIAFLAGGLNAAQQLMGHYRATTTDIYVRSAGLYADKQIIVDALNDNGIGVAANELFTKMPHKIDSHEAFCKHGNVNNILQ